MEKGRRLSVGLLVELAEGRRQGLTHEENGRLHGVGYSTSKYAQRWCEKMRRTAEAYLKTQSLRSIRTYRSELSLDVAESLSLQEGCARHGWASGKYRMLEYACRPGLLERELTGRGPEEEPSDMEKRRRRAATLTELERALEAALKRHGAVRSMSGRGSCYDNAVIESHFGNLKGWMGRLDRVSEGRAREMIDEAARYFNEERILLKLGGLSPAEYLREYEKRQESGRKSSGDI